MSSSGGDTTRTVMQELWTAAHEEGVTDLASAARSQASVHALFAPPETMRSPQVGRHVGIVAAMAGVVMIAALGTLVVHGSKSSPSWPKHWDPRVASIAAFDEAHHNLKFTHPVPVVFLNDVAFRAKVEGAVKITAKGRTQAATALGELRALGLASGSPDLISGDQKLQGSIVDGFYDPRAKTVWVRGDTLTPQVRVVLAHELTHALQDQNFGLRDRDAGDDATLAYTALIEADAVRVQDLYANSMSPADRAAYHKAEDSMGDAAQPAAPSVPAALVEEEEFPYQIGPQFLDALTAANGSDAINDALRNPPTASIEIMEPGRYLHHDPVFTVSGPALAPGDKVVDPASTGGALQLFEILYDRLDATQAWAAARTWAGDSSVGYTAHGRTCVRLDVATSPDSQPLYQALQTWAQRSGGSVSMVAGNVRLDACDPGPAAKTPPPPKLGVLDVIGIRGELAKGIRSAAPTLTRNQVDCVADALVQVANTSGLQHMIDLADNPAAATSYGTELGRRAVPVIAGTCRNP